MKKQIRLKNGKIVNINPNLTGYILFQLEKEGVITKSFMTSLLSTGDIQNIDIFDSMRTVYAAYRQATPTDFMDFDSFMKIYEVDVVEALHVFTAIMQKETRKNKMAQGFKAKQRGKKA
ncbi:MULTISPECIES: hypothetical protein [Bacillus]|uniref:Phage protein n=2 Tax=Bacillus thuringiensis TaxID=1428 RepID=A0A9W3ZRT1_BACTO|nr:MULTISPECIES: hypothetical protein [Bacillus]MEB8712960.1 hypothetical protein [Bacillus cereus]MRC49297.1 hypothetical protein [Bacillus thuringiensis]MEB9594833.1 hypothetical protein [Bacillus cereus]MRD27630.1 hypothetical protein [Bacillus thuringiensis]OUB49889.1 hypothetical protein BK716_15975 [Bacillus thuringiensis serovar higo]